jgi:hypothetical protein
MYDSAKDKTDGNDIRAALPRIEAKIFVSLSSFSSFSEISGASGGCKTKMRRAED